MHGFTFAGTQCFQRNQRVIQPGVQQHRDNDQKQQDAGTVFCPHLSADTEIGHPKIQRCEKQENRFGEGQLEVII